jgi:hypothetical protein
MTAVDYWKAYDEKDRRLVINHLREESIKAGLEAHSLQRRPRTGAETRRMNACQARSDIFARAQAVLEEVTVSAPFV